MFCLCGYCVHMCMCRTHSYVQGEVMEIIIHSGVNRATAVLHPGAMYKGQRLPTQVLYTVHCIAYSQTLYSQLRYIWVKTDFVSTKIFKKSAINLTLFWSFRGDSGATASLRPKTELINPPSCSQIVRISAHNVESIEDRIREAERQMGIREPINQSVNQKNK